MNDFTYFLFLRSVGMIINHSSIGCRNAQVGLPSAPIHRLSFFRTKNRENPSQLRQNFLFVLSLSLRSPQIHHFDRCVCLEQMKKTELPFTVNWNDKQCSHSSGEREGENQLAKQHRAKAIPHFCTTAVLRITLVDQFFLSGENEEEKERNQKAKKNLEKKKIRDRLILSPLLSLSLD